MKYLTFIIILTITISSAAGAGDLKIYLPRQVQIESSTPSLGQIAIIRGTEDMIAKAQDVSLGRISMPDQKIVIEKSTLLGRLASNGIDSAKVELTGAEKVTISRKHQTITANEIMQVAAKFMKKQLPDSSICRFDAVYVPQDMIVPGQSDEIKFSCELSENTAVNRGRVRVTAFCDGVEIDHRDVVFAFKYKCRQVVAVSVIPKGRAINAGNVKIENTISSRPESTDWKVPYGLITRKPLRAGQVISDNDLTVPKPEMLLKRNQAVSIKIDNPGLTAMASGRTLQPGAVGDVIKVRNIDSNIVIVARINEDGSVEPIL